MKIINRDGDPDDVLVAVAPFSLPEDYTFDVIIDGKTFPVTVPPGGCVEGDIIEIPVVQDDMMNLSEYVKSNEGSEDKNNDKDWNHSLFACFEIFFSGLFWMSICFPWVVIGQLLQRIKLNICCLPWVPGSNYQSTCAQVVIFTILIGYTIPGILSFLGSSTFFITAPYQSTANMFIVLSSAVSVYSMLVLLGWHAQLRSEFRRRFGIKPYCCQNNKYCDDICIAFWCHCCSLIQVGREVPESIEDNYSYSCCTATGLQKGSPDIV